MSCSLKVQEEKRSVFQLASHCDNRLELSFSALLSLNVTWDVVGMYLDCPPNRKFKDDSNLKKTSLIDFPTSSPNEKLSCNVTHRKKNLRNTSKNENSHAHPVSRVSYKLVTNCAIYQVQHHNGWQVGERIKFLQNEK